MRWRCVAHHFRVKRSKVKVIGVVRSFGLVRSVAPSLLDRPIHFICGIHTTHEVTMCRAPFPGQKVKGQGHRGRSKFWLCPLRPYWTDSLHMWYTSNPWGEDVSRTISGSKGQRSRSQWSFEVLPCPLHGSVPIGPIHFICGIHTTHEVTMCRAPFQGQKVKGKGHRGRLKFLLCPLWGSVPIEPNHSLCGTHTAREVTMYRAPFPGGKVKGQGHRGRS